MRTRQKPIVTPEQQALLDGVVLRLITGAERQRFDEQMVQGHYLHNAQLVGEQLRYVAEYQGQWVALMIWSAGAYKLKLREAWIGWSDRQKKRRLTLVANNSRFFKEQQPPRGQTIARCILRQAPMKDAPDWSDPKSVAC